MSWLTECRWGRAHLHSQISWLLFSSCGAAERRSLARRIYGPDVEQVILDSPIYPRSSLGVAALHLLLGRLPLPYGSQIPVRLSPVRVAQSCHLVSITPLQSAGRQPTGCLGKVPQRVSRSWRERRHGVEVKARTPDATFTESSLPALPQGGNSCFQFWVWKISG